MATDAARLIVCGILGEAPFAGVAWQVLHYLEGLRRLGHDVYYVEDTGAWPYDPDQNTITDDPSYTVSYIARLMHRIGMSDCWAYRTNGPNGGTFGCSESELRRVLASADGLINLTGSTVLGDEHAKIPVRIYLETDPVLPQIEVANGRRFTISMLEAHTHHFTFGENLGRPGCVVPTGPFTYWPTRQPVVLDWWQGSNKARAPSRVHRYTTVGSWQQRGKDIEWKGETYSWSKHHEFLKFIDVPGFTSSTFELALACDDIAVLSKLACHGWQVRDALPLSKDVAPYRDFILESDCEFTVAKDQNIRLKSGWFSDRSACYLAAGKPTIAQDTGFDVNMPTGKGLFSFRTMEDVVSAVNDIESHYDSNAAAAKEIAAAHFRAETVLAKLLVDAGLT